MQDIGIFYDHVVYFMEIWYTLWPFCKFFGYLVRLFPCWYVVPRKIWQPCLRHVGRCRQLPCIKYMHACIDAYELLFKFFGRANALIYLF
jgi:hypothetical protein